MVDWQTSLFFFFLLNLVGWQAKVSYKGSYEKLIQEVAQMQCSVNTGQPRILGLPLILNPVLCRAVVVQLLSPI